MASGLLGEGRKDESGDFTNGAELELRKPDQSDGSAASETRTPNSNAATITNHSQDAKISVGKHAATAKDNAVDRMGLDELERIAQLM